jgi:hypothetical protein
MSVPTQHLSLNGHACSKIDDVMDIKHLNRKRAYMDTVKTFFILAEIKKNNQLNDKNIVCCNNIFLTNSRWGQSLQ